MEAVDWIVEAGFPEAQLEEFAGLLVIKLSAQDRARLLADPALRDRVIAAGKSHGFSRCAIQI